MSTLTVNGPSLLYKAEAYDEPERVNRLGLYPYFRPIASAQGTEVRLADGRTVLMLGSNSYLGLVDHPELKRAASAAVGKYGTGSTGSRFLNGTLDIHLELEERLAALVHKETALLYSTGFQTNLGVITALVGKRDCVIADRDDHASIVDGCRLALGEFLRFPHNDMGGLAAALGRCPGGAGKLIVVDGVFSMSGDIAPLPRIVELADRFGAAVMVDDAHGVGVLGENGAGTVEHFGLFDEVPLIVGTFSKSFASLGGFVASDRKTIQYLKHHSRPLIFSASMSPANAAAVLAALDIMEREPERRERLWHNAAAMRDGLRRLGLDVGNSETPIIPVHVGDVMKGLRMCKRLEEEGVFVNLAVPPAVPPHRTLLRISLMATHTDAQIRLALEKIEKVAAELDLI